MHVFVWDSVCERKKKGVYVAEQIRIFLITTWKIGSRAK